MIETAIFKTGKLPATDDARTLLFRSVLRAAAKVPATYSLDLAHPGCRPRMFLNDTYGDCVIAARAEQQMRFGLLRNGAAPNITDAEVKREYFRETGGADSGLNMLASLKAWRKGWTAGGARRTISAYAAVDYRSPTEVKQAIYIHGGIPIGVNLPDDAMDEFTRGKPWSTTRRPPDPDEGHCVYLTGWTKAGPTAITWAQYQQLSWAWLKKYGDEAWTVFDNLDQPRFRNAIDHAAVRRYLEEVTA
jgi:hypothetical protein